MQKIDYDFIEIGTSDFDNLISSCSEDEVGISIEPVVVYFDNLPDKKNVKKLNCAVSNRDYTEILYWVEASDIQKYGLPNWIRGCGTVGHTHPLIIKELSSRNLLDIYKKSECDVLSWDTLVIKEKINSVKFLKIDAEGSDYNILESILTSKSGIIPDKIQFENKDFADNERLSRLLQSYNELNYSVFNLDLFNIIIQKAHMA